MKKKSAPEQKQEEHVQEENFEVPACVKRRRRHKKKRFKDCMMEVLSLPISREEDFKRLAKMGMRVEDMDNRTLLAAAMFEKAVESGNVTAFKEICALIGETDIEDGESGIEKLIQGLKEEK